jgi:lipopolysaccharide export system protein LptC
MSSPTARGPGPAPTLAESDIARRQRTAALWRRHSREIRVYRKVLPGLIILIGLTLGAWVIYNALAWRFAPAENASVAIRMVNPKFSGRSSDDSPYVISAASAVRDDRDLQRVVMVKPRFIQNAGLATEMILESKDGVFREDTRILRLEKDLVVVDKRGYTFTAERAVVDTKTGSVQGESAIQGNGPLGRITASSYAVTPGGDHVFFRGDVHTRIEHGVSPRNDEKVTAQ